LLQNIRFYYPFGMQMPGRNFNSSEYRFGFNGKEKDDEWTGITGATYDYGFRIYDSRVARFLSVDPLTGAFPGLTPYQYASNSPIQNIDLDGLEGVRPPRYATNTQLNNRPPSAGTMEYTKYNPISRNNKKSVSYFDPSNVSGGSSYTDPIFTRNNFSGQNGAAAGELLNQVMVKLVEKTTQTNYSYGASRSQKQFSNYKIEFLNPESEQKFNQMQKQYEQKYNEAVSMIKVPELPKNNDDFDRYQKESLSYNLQVAAVKIDLGASPYEKIISNVENNKDNYNVETTVEELPVIYETPSNQ